MNYWKVCSLSDNAHWTNNALNRRTSTHRKNSYKLIDFWQSYIILIVNQAILRGFSYSIHLPYFQWMTIFLESCLNIQSINKISNQINSNPYLNRLVCPFIPVKLFIKMDFTKLLIFIWNLKYSHGKFQGKVLSLFGHLCNKTGY